MMGVNSHPTPAKHQNEKAFSTIRKEASVEQIGNKRVQVLLKQAIDFKRNFERQF